jgi:hypothetical protein
MRTETINLYQFHELSDEAKARAILEYGDINVDHGWWESTYEDEEHGDQCETYKTACKFLDDWDDLVLNHSDQVTTDRVAEENEGAFDREADDLEDEFLDNILEDYSIMLQEEYEERCSDDAVQDTIEANEFEFYENGTKY